MEPITLSRTNLDPVSHPVRRHALASLVDESAPVSLDTLAAEIARRQRSGPPETASPFSREMERMRLLLHHQHLPKLAANGLVEYEDEAHTAELLVDDGQVYSMLDAFHDVALTLE